MYSQFWVLTSPSFRAQAALKVEHQLEVEGDTELSKSQTGFYTWSGMHSFFTLFIGQGKPCDQGFYDQGEKTEFSSQR